MLLHDAAASQGSTAPATSFCSTTRITRHGTGPRSARAWRASKRRSAARRSPGRGPYQLQAAIVAVHDQASRARDTNWREVAALYDELHRIAPAPVVELDRAVAVAMADGAAAGLAVLHASAAARELQAAIGTMRCAPSSSPASTEEPKQRRLTVPPPTC